MVEGGPEHKLSNRQSTLQGVVGNSLLMKHDILVHDVLTLVTCVQYHMKRFVEKVVSLMKDEKLFASQGGPIILSQVPSPLVSSMLVHQFTNSCFSAETTYNKN